MNFEGLPTFGVARSCRLAEEANILLVVVVGASGTFDLSKHLFFGRTTLDKGLGVKPLHRGKAMSWFHRFQSLNHAKKRVAWFQSCFEGKRGSGDDEDVLRFNLTGVQIVFQGTIYCRFCHLHLVTPPPSPDSYLRSVSIFWLRSFCHETDPTNQKYSSGRYLW